MRSVDTYFTNLLTIECIVALMLMCALNVLLAGCSAKSNTVSSNPVITASNGKSTVSSYSTAMLGLSDISSFDVYVDNNQIIHLIASGKHAATDRHTVIRYTRSEDDGHHWIETVNIDRLPTVSGKRGNDIQLAASGRHLVAIWQTEGEFPGMGPMVTCHIFRSWKNLDHRRQSSSGRPGQSSLYRCNCRSAWRFPCHLVRRS